MARPIGIDLGTTYSAVAFVNDVGTPEILPNRDSERLTPSVVWFQGDEVVVGAQARRSAATAPESVVQFVKRQMGNGTWRFEAETGRSYRPEEVSSLILRRLAEDAELALGEPIGPVVITVPAYFDDAQRQATRDAGTMAGLAVHQVLNEPTSAAVAYGLGSREQGKVLVYDLGGGTFDVTLLRIEGETFESIATHGDPHLGGFDWDNLLIEWLNQEFQAQGGPSLSEDPRLLADLRDKAESLKRNLTIRDTGAVFLSAGGVNAKITVTRSKFEELTQHLLNRTETTLDLVMDDAGLNYADVDRVILVGGSTKMPMVKDLVKRVTGHEPQRGVNPDEVVALGAAIVASMVALKSPTDIAIKDVTAHSLGVIALSEDESHLMNFVVLPRNTRIPSHGTQHLITVEDQQTALEIKITEGEGAEVDYVKVVGQSMLRIPAYPRGAPVQVNIGYDIDGLIEVSVYDATANQEVGRFEIDRQSNMDRGEVERRTADMREEVVI
jgi:molecular chaperone DnaK